MLFQEFLVKVYPSPCSSDVGTAADENLGYRGMDANRSPDKILDLPIFDLPNLALRETLETGFLQQYQSRSHAGET